MLDEPPWAGEIADAFAKAVDQAGGGPLAEGEWNLLYELSAQAIPAAPELLEGVQLAVAPWVLIVVEGAAYFAHAGAGVAEVRSLGPLHGGRLTERLRYDDSQWHLEIRFEHERLPQPLVVHCAGDLRGGERIERGRSIESAAALRELLRRWASRPAGTVY